jgi:hypothetical protein
MGHRLSPSNSGQQQQQPFHASGVAQKLQMNTAPASSTAGGIPSSRQAGGAQAAAAAIAAAAAQKGPGGMQDPAGAQGPATDAQGNILPLSRLQEIWSR